MSSESIRWQAQPVPSGGQEGQRAQGQCCSWPLIAYCPKKTNLEDPTSARPAWVHRDVRGGERTGPGGGGGEGWIRGLPLREDDGCSLAREITDDSRGKEPNMKMSVRQEVGGAVEEGCLKASRREGAVGADACMRGAGFSPETRLCPAWFPSCEASAAPDGCLPEAPSLIFAQVCLLADSGGRGWLSFQKCDSNTVCSVAPSVGTTVMAIGCDGSESEGGVIIPIVRTETWWQWGVLRGWA